MAAVRPHRMTRLFTPHGYGASRAVEGIVDVPTGPLRHLMGALRWAATVLDEPRPTNLRRPREDQPWLSERYLR